MLHSHWIKLLQICHAFGFVIVLYGALVLIFAVLSHFQPLAILKGLVLIIVGEWFCQFGG